MDKNVINKRKINNKYIYNKQIIKICFNIK